MRAGYFALFVFIEYHVCCVALPHDATGLSAVCDCGISYSYSLFFRNVNSTPVYFDNFAQIGCAQVCFSILKRYFIRYKLHISIP